MSATTTLLLVEDDDLVRSALTRALNRTGVFAVTPAENGEQALALLDTQPADAILTDLQMPVMDGLTLLGHLLERGVATPVAVMTGQHITPELAARLQAYGIAATFTKPIDISTLVDELQRSLSPTSVGRIAGITLFGFLQLVEVERKTTLIVVRSGGHEGRLYFDRGALVHGETRTARGLDAVYEIIGWPDPKLEIFYKRKSRERTVTQSLQHVLMEAARLLDERARPPDGPRPEAGGTAAPAPAPRAALHTVLDDAMRIDGAVGAALVDGRSGAVLASAGENAALDLELADFVRARQRTVEGVMITLTTQHHLLRVLADGRGLLYLVVDRGRASLGMARRTLAALAQRVTL